MNGCRIHVSRSFIVLDNIIQNQIHPKLIILYTNKRTTLCRQNVQMPTEAKKTPRVKVNISYPLCGIALYSRTIAVTEHIVGENSNHWFIKKLSTYPDYFYYFMQFFSIAMYRFFLHKYERCMLSII